MTGPVAIRYRAGMVCESLRVVHTAVELPTGDFRSVCHKTFYAIAVEIVDGGGMPCEQCVALLCRRSRDDRPELDRSGE